MTAPNENGQGDSALRDCTNQIVQDWREYLIGVGTSFPPNEEEYRTFFERMTANIEGAENCLKGSAPILQADYAQLEETFPDFWENE